MHSQWWGLKNFAILSLSLALALVLALARDSSFEVVRTMN